MSIYRSLPIGVDDYKKLIDANSMYIDKTLLIKEFWHDGSEVILTPRPRRFGKTLNLSMLKYFFSKTEEDTAYLFENTKIWEYPEFRSLQGQFPVIFLTFKDVKYNSWKSAHAELTEFLTIQIEKLLSPIYTSLTPVEQRWYTRLLDKTATDADYTNTLLYATVILERYHQRKVIVLIDEYDAPIMHAYLHDYYPNMIQFMRILLSKVLKSNTALAKGFLTGITRTSKDGIFSGLNHLSVCTVLDIHYSDKFGFTQNEVDQLLMNYNLLHKRDEIKYWYDGYIFGKTNIYNPWSLLYCLKNEGLCETYWVNTSNNDLIEDLIATSSQEIKADIELLMQDHAITNKEIDKNIALADLKKSHQALWSMFLFTGYVTTTSYSIIDGKFYYTLTIPNKEISLLYQDLVAKSINQTLQSGELSTLLTALITGDYHRLTELLQEFVANSCSFYDVPGKNLEHSIHMFVLGLLAGLSNRYIIQSNRESGDGRYDIMIMPKDKHKTGILIEFKRAKNNQNETLVASAQQALDQIKTLDYKTQMKTFGHSGQIFYYGIAVYGKHLVVKMEKI